MGITFPKIILFFFILFGSLLSFEQKTLFFNTKSKKKISLDVEVASTDYQKRKGLMLRKWMDPNKGMIFVYKKNRILHFWMKNTYIPLSIAFIDNLGKIVHIADMIPLDTTSVSSKKPAKYAVEVNKGWFRKNKISVGDTMEFDH